MRARDHTGAAHTGDITPDDPSPRTADTHGSRRAGASLPRDSDRSCRDNPPDHPTDQ